MQLKMVWKLLFLALIGLAQHFNHTDAQTGQCQENIIKGGITNQSTTYGNNRPSYRATDADPNTCTHTNFEANPWWRIDLQGLFEVSCIGISNISNTIDMTGSEIFIQNYTEEDGIKCNQINTTLNNQNKTYPCFWPILGRYITVRKANHGAIVLCDVNIFGRGWRLIRENKTWEEAMHHCSDRDMKLVSVTDDNVQTLVALEAQKADSPFVWLGLRYSCALYSWFWVDSQKLCYRQWAPGSVWMRPDEGCFLSAAIEKKGNNNWFVKSENEMFNFICEV